MIKINKKKLEGFWITIESLVDMKFFVVPFPYTVATTNFIFDEEDEKAREQKLSWLIFNYCVKDWEGVVDDDSNKLECNEENRKIIFDHDAHIYKFIINQIYKAENKVIEELGN
jgi:hypothetical protein